MTGIKIKYSAVDGFRQTRTFKTLKAAKAFIVDRVGEHPEVGSHYAVSGDGVGKVEVGGQLADGCPVTLDDFFPQQQAVTDDESAYQYDYDYDATDDYDAAATHDVSTAWNPNESPGMARYEHHPASVAYRRDMAAQQEYRANQAIMEGVAKAHGYNRAYHAPEARWIIDDEIPF